MYVMCKDMFLRRNICQDFLNVLNSFLLVSVIYNLHITFLTTLLRRLDHDGSLLNNPILFCLGASRHVYTITVGYVLHGFVLSTYSGNIWCYKRTEKVAGNRQSGSGFPYRNVCDVCMTIVHFQLQ